MSGGGRGAGDGGAGTAGVGGAGGAGTAGVGGLGGIRRWPQVKAMRTPAALRARLGELGLELPVDDEVVPAPDGPLARPLSVPAPEPAAGAEPSGGRGGARWTVGNRFAVLPMEGWDGTEDGRPTDLARRRWRRFGESGAKLVWGGEAVAVRPDGRANPHQLCMGPAAADDLAALRAELVAAHEAAHGRSDDLLVGLQLTHSGRWSRPAGAPAPRPAHRHPELDRRLGLDGPAGDAAVLDDDELDELAAAFVDAAGVAADAGFAFVDLKACHGYLGHELLSAWGRPGRYGGEALEDRARWHLGLVRAVRAARPGLGVGVRLSLYDVAPYRPGPDGVGEPAWSGPGGAADEPGRFGGGGPLATGGGLLDAVDLSEPVALAGLLADAGVTLLCATAGSPYTNPHIQRPAYFPPSDGYGPPEDPLVGVARMAHATAAVRAAVGDRMAVVGSGLSYLQDFVPHAAQALVAGGWMDTAGLGRMVLSYPGLPADALAGRPLDRRSVCRTFSDCTTAPRNGLVSGCYPLDDLYKHRPERVALAAAKRRGRA